MRTASLMRIASAPWQRRALALAPLLVLLLAARAGWAQQGAAAPIDLPKPSELEPSVDTSRSGAAPQAPAPAAVPGSATAPPAAAGAQALAAPRSGGAGTAKPSTTKDGKALDRLELDTTDITGNRELPKVMYIVPWKRPDLGDLAGRPANSLLDEVLTPVDRDVFRRENRYYEALKPDAAHPAGSTGRGSETAGPAAAGPASGP